jgi:pyruvate kinase
MLQSMVEASTPTRAEASDVATAVYLGVDAVMLSAETAVGRHPMSAIAIMDRVIRAVERDEDYWLHLPPILPSDRKGEAAAIAAAATEAVRSHECGGLAAFTQSGATAFAIARERPRENIIAVTTSPRAARAATLCWGVTAVVMAEVTSFEDVMAQTRELAASSGLFDRGEPIALVAGLPIGTKGRTNVLHLLDPPAAS